MLKPLLFLAFCSTALAASPDPTKVKLNAMTDLMAAQAQHQQHNQTALHPRSQIVGLETTDPYKIPGHKVRSSIEVGDGFKSHIAHDAVAQDGTHKLIIVGQETERDWIIVGDEKVSPAPGTVFSGTNMAAGKPPIACTINGNPGIAFGYLMQTAEGWRADGSQVKAFTLDSKSQLIPLPYKVLCTRK